MEEKKPLHSKSGAFIILSNDAINASSTSSNVLKVCASFFVIWIFYRKTQSSTGTDSLLQGSPEILQESPETLQEALCPTGNFL